jgi:hypothetical protein
MLSSQVGSIGSFPDSLTILVTSMIEYESNLMHDFNGMVKHIDVLCRDCESLEKKKNKLQNKSVVTIKEHMIPHHNLSVEEATREHNEAVEYCNFYIKAVTTVSMPMIALERKERISQVFLYLSACMKAIGLSIAESSDAFFVAMKVDPTNIMKEANVVLESLSLPPLPTHRTSLSSFSSSSLDQNTLPAPP